MPTGINVPPAGLSLRSGDQPGDLSARPNQIMRLNLVQSTLDDLIQSLRKEQPARLRLGKHPSLHYGGKSHSFHAYPETHRSEIFHTSDQESLYFTGLLSHSLEVEKAKNATAATDQALADLEEKLNAHERGKESKKTHIISHPDELRGLRGSKAGYKGPTSKIELEKDRFLKTAANRSLTASPTLGAPKSPALAMTPTSAPTMQNKDRERLDALKIPFIHLLAVRAVSVKFLARVTCSTPEDCTVLAEKYAVQNRINTDKYDLRDKIYKDLDLWGFKYTPEDRKDAIENSISAFDRMRVSKSDPIWQKLLPKAERGKGTCLSRLNLRTAPPPKPAPKPKVSGAEDSGRDEGDHAASKASASKTTSISQKARSSDKDITKPKPKPKTTNSTLTGRVTKKAATKAPAKLDGNSKIKSAEYVHDSDEDDDVDMLEGPAQPAPAPKQQPEHKRVPSNVKAPAAKIKAPVKSRPTEAPSDSVSAPVKAPTKVPKSETAKPKLEPSKPTTKVTASKRPPSRPSTSPQKPSPLGSSPPANASESAGRKRSDSQNQSSGSSSSSPLMSQHAKTNKAGPPAAAPKPPVAKTTTQANGVTKAAANPLKRKAEPDRLSVPQAGRPTGNLEAKRRRAVSTTSSGGSTGSASPPMSHQIMWQKLQEKSRKFKRLYSKYRALHASLAEKASPSSDELDRLQNQHNHLGAMKREIWDEDRRLKALRS
ncbi:unnamed protein product [Penicillium salamii]|uniref:E3 ubiquitin-protein ligase n=1 Tax=Penicillium salamii TaxID=1612424 RepID=A0A9W4JUZ1_9EURO|nr:unnamed protein product [Penicillium salamii]